jgi:hypothetical protein
MADDRTADRLCQEAGVEELPFLEIKTDRRALDVPALRAAIESLPDWEDQRLFSGPTVLALCYELFFTGPVPTDAELARHFQGRRHYEIRDTLARYSNPCTDVYFAFEGSRPPDGAGAEHEWTRPWASFDMNLFRPGFFATEAAIELQAFVERFKCRIIDPQVDGMAEVDFTAEGFRAGWETANELARRSIGTSDKVVTRPADELEQVWRWNYGQPELQARLGEEIHVPRIFYLSIDGRLCSASLWADGVPLVLPKTDVVLVYRNQLAPRRRLRRQPGLAVVPWEIALGRLGPAPLEDEPLPHHVPTAAGVPAGLASWIRSLPAIEAPRLLRMDQILEAEET